jgi:hypothetical protein
VLVVTLRYLAVQLLLPSDTLRSNCCYPQIHSGQIAVTVPYRTVTYCLWLFSLPPGMLAFYLHCIICISSPSHPLNHSTKHNQASYLYSQISFWFAKLCVTVTACFGQNTVTIVMLCMSQHVAVHGTAHCIEIAVDSGRWHTELLQRSVAH